MTKQEVYDKVKAHLLAQNAKSHLQAGGTCMYRSYDGLKCAVGALIADEHYDNSFEGLGVGSEDVRHVLVKSGVLLAESEEGVSFLRTLQRIHDHVDPTEWAERLTDFAVGRGLTP